MLGQMMHRPLSIIEILRFAAETHSKSDIVSVRTEGDMHRYTYPDAYLRVCQLANAFEKLGVKAGDRIATLAWNGYRHFELYYAISGVGAVCHTINPRLSAEQMIYITQHASDSIMCVDLTFVPLVEALSEKFGLPLLAKIPISEDTNNKADGGIPLINQEINSSTKLAIEQLV